MAENTLVLDKVSPPNNTPFRTSAETTAEEWKRSAPTMPGDEPLLREALGATLRENRSQSGFTLRELAQLANVSPGYLSELERGRKEVSSELLASVCHAMGVSVASVILESASMMTLDAAAAELAASMAATR